MSDFRIERDSMGELKVPADALYGAQTQRAVNNFLISGLTMPRQFIRALGLIKSAAAQANSDLGHLKKASAKAIAKAAERVAAGEFDKQFPIDVFQTGSGTSSNMNANEVIAHVCSAAGAKVHPNDDVNMGQSSNDVIPTTIQVSAALAVSEQLLPALAHLKATLDKRAKELKTVAKTGRTHLMDAMPVTLHSQKFWEGPERIVDAVASDAGGQNRFVLLLPDGLTIQDSSGAAISRVVIPSGQTASRNPRGFLEHNGNIVSAVFQTQTCTVALDTHNLVECHPTANRAPADREIPP